MGSVLAGYFLRSSLRAAEEGCWLVPGGEWRSRNAEDIPRSQPSVFRSSSAPSRPTTPLPRAAPCSCATGLFITLLSSSCSERNLLPAVGKVTASGRNPSLPKPWDCRRVVSNPCRILRTQSKQPRNTGPDWPLPSPQFPEGWSPAVKRTQKMWWPGYPGRGCLRCRCALEV